MKRREGMDRLVKRAPEWNSSKQDASGGLHVQFLH